jgi:T-complex protein 1 subunit beta
VGDGTTSVTVLASELIREAEKLIDMRIHPQTIIAGWRKATQVRLKSELVAESGPDQVRYNLTMALKNLASNLGHRTCS